MGMHTCTGVLSLQAATLHVLWLLRYVVHTPKASIVMCKQLSNAASHAAGCGSIRCCKTQVNGQQEGVDVTVNTGSGNVNTPEQKWMMNYTPAG